MAVCPKSSWPWVRALLHSVYDQPDAASVHAQFDRVLDALADKLPRVAEHLEAARADVLAFTAFPGRSGGRSGRTTPPSGSTGRSAGAPTWSASSPTATRWSGWSVPCWPSSMTSGPKAAATSARRPRPLPHPTRHRHRLRHRGGDHSGAQRLATTEITRQSSHTTPADLTYPDGRRQVTRLQDHPPLADEAARVFPAWHRSP